jgi:hypothetical protein
MKKLGCAKCGGTKKMKLGGSAVAKAPVNMYGIPQENMGTSSQMGFGKKGGSVKKMQVGGTSTAPKKPIVKKTVAPKKTTVPRKIIDSSVPMTGPSRPTPKPMMAKKGGIVNKMQDGGTSSTKTNMFGKTKEISKTKAEKIGTRFASKKNHTFEDVGDEASYTIKPKAKSKRSVTTTFFKIGGAVKKPLMKAQSGGRIVNSPDGKSQGIVPGNDNYKSYSAVGTKKRSTPYQDYMKRPGADASDTLVKSGSTWAGYNAKNPKNNKALIKAVKATDKVSPMKKGGVIKSKKK